LRVGIVVRRPRHKREENRSPCDKERSPCLNAGLSVLAPWYSHHKTIELGGHRNLARQTRMRRRPFDKLQHGLFARTLGADFTEPYVVDTNMAGAAGISPPALAIDPINAVLDCTFHDRRANEDLYGVLDAIALDIGHLHHAARFRLTNRHRTKLVINRCLERIAIRQTFADP